MYTVVFRSIDGRFLKNCRLRRGYTFFFFLENDSTPPTVSPRYHSYPMRCSDFLLFSPFSGYFFYHLRPRHIDSDVHFEALRYLTVLLLSSKEGISLHTITLHQNFQVRRTLLRRLQKVQQNVHDNLAYGF